MLEEFRIDQVEAADKKGETRKGKQDTQYSKTEYRLKMQKGIWFLTDPLKTKSTESTRHPTRNGTTLVSNSSLPDENVTSN